MERFEIYYTVYNPDGTVKLRGTIKKTLKNAVKRMMYLSKLYLSNVVFY